MEKKSTHIYKNNIIIIFFSFISFNFLLKVEKSGMLQKKDKPFPNVEHMYIHISVCILVYLNAYSMHFLKKKIFNLYFITTYFIKSG